MPDIKFDLLEEGDTLLN